MQMHNSPLLFSGNDTLTRKIFVTTHSPRKTIDLKNLQTVNSISNRLNIKDGNKPDLIHISQPKTETEPPETTVTSKFYNYFIVSVEVKSRNM